jgi:hypothetical protein
MGRTDGGTLRRSLTALRQAAVCPQAMSVVVTDRLDFLIQTCMSAGQPLERLVDINAGWIACSSGTNTLIFMPRRKHEGAPL